MTPFSTTGRGRQRLPRRTALVLVLVCFCVWGAAACSGGGSGSGTDPLGVGSKSSGDLSGGLGAPLTVGDAVITVKSLEAAFQPVAPTQRLSDETLAAPASGEGFYQAYVHVENRGQAPLRIDPEDFVCRVGNTIHTLEPTRSGPAARSIIYGTSLDLVLTFRGKAGLEPILVYSPPWRKGIVSFAKGTPTQGQGQSTTSLGAGQLGSTTTTEASSQ